MPAEVARRLRGADFWVTIGPSSAWRALCTRHNGVCSTRPSCARASRRRVLSRRIVLHALRLISRRKPARARPSFRRRATAGSFREFFPPPEYRLAFYAESRTSTKIRRSGRKILSRCDNRRGINLRPRLQLLTKWFNSQSTTALEIHPTWD